MNSPDRISEKEICAYIAGQLGPEETGRVESAIQASPEVRDSYLSLRQTWELLDRYRVPEVPPGGLEDLHRRLKTETLLRRRAVWRWVAVGAAACFLVAVGIGVSIGVAELGGGAGNGSPSIVGVHTEDGLDIRHTDEDLPVARVSRPSPWRGNRRFVLDSEGRPAAGATYAGGVGSDLEPNRVTIREITIGSGADRVQFEEYTTLNYDYSGEALEAEFFRGQPLQPRLAVMGPL